MGREEDGGEEEEEEFFLPFVRKWSWSYPLPPPPSSAPIPGSLLKALPSVAPRHSRQYPLLQRTPVLKPPHLGWCQTAI